MSEVIHAQMFIDGKWTEGADPATSFELKSPFNGSPVATVAKGSIADVDAAVSAAKNAFEEGSWRGTSPADRAAVLRRVAARIGERLDEFTVLQCREIGAPARIAGAFHVGLAINHLNHLADQTEEYSFVSEGPEIGPVPAEGIIRREPLGVCAAIVPWNIPLLLSVWKIAPALAAGNSVVIKPDEKAPLIVIELVREFAAAGLPSGVLNLVTGEGETVGAHLVSHQDVKKVAFTGSTAVGKSILSAVADSVKRVTLELGGKGANIVLDDADIDTAVDGAIFACMAYSGQACESGTRLLLPSSLHDDFVERLVARVKTLRLGDPSDANTDIGPLISGEQRDRVLDFIGAAKETGAKVAVGGKTPKGATFEHGHFVEPTVFVDVTNDMPIAREEVFGPVLSVLKYETVEEAIEIANDTPYGLSAGVWSGNEKRALDIASKLDVGMVYINDWHVISEHYPFGGTKESGIGREVGPRALDAYTEAKAVTLNRSPGPEARAFALVLNPTV